MAKKLQILRGTTAQNDSYTGSIGELTMDTEKVEVRIHDGTTQGGKTIGSGGASLPILTCVFSDHKLNDMSWLNADTFSWQSGDVYKAAYEHLGKDAESGGLYYRWSTRSDAAAGYDRNIKTRIPTVGEKFYTATDEGWVDTGVTVAQIIDENTVVDSEGATLYWLGNMTNLPADRKEETISGTTVTYFQAEDGHKICLPDQESNVQALYEVTGSADYYILDTTNKQFKLPRKQKRTLIQAVKNTDGTWYNLYSDGWVEQGGDIPINTSSISLPIEMENTTYMCIISFRKTYSETTLSFATISTHTQTTTGFTCISSASTHKNWQVSGYAAESAYASAGMRLEYYYVGNFEQSALEQTAGITSEQLNNKLDKSAEISLVPTGCVAAFAGTTAPTGWLKCDGSAISRTTYAALFAAIGTKYGTGDGSTTFNLPTQSVLPLGTSAPIVYNPSNTVQWVKNLNGNNINSYKPDGGYSVGLLSKSNGISDGILYNETSDNNFTPTNIDLHGTHYTDLANATGALAIVCIKY